MTAGPRLVVGAVIVEAGRVLAARRTRPAESCGRWEFPGGKVEDGEDPRAALIREIREELAASIAISGEVVADCSPWRISAAYVLRLYVASLVQGEPQPGADHDALRWLALDALESLDWLPSDRLALPAVRAALSAGRPRRPG
jgi:8-oxo-dGTP diphosphatase